MPFVKAYKFTRSNRFGKVIPASKNAAPDECLAIGANGDAGLATRVAPDGAVLWSRRYVLVGASLAFIDGVATDDGGFALLAGKGITPDGERYTDFVLVRIGNSGSVLWSRLINSNGLPGWGRLLHRQGAPEEFLVIAWNALAGATSNIDTAALMLFAADGSARLSARLQMPDVSGRLFDAVATGDGYILVGDCATKAHPAPDTWWTNDQMAYDSLGASGLVIKLDRDLKAHGFWLITGSNRENGFSLRAALASSPEGIVVAGAVGTSDLHTRSTLLALARLTFGANGTLSSVKALTCGLIDQHSRPVRIEALGGDYVVLNLDRPASSPQSATVLRVGPELLPKAQYGFDFDSGAQVLDLRVAASGTVLTSGALPSQPGLTDGWLLSVDNAFSCCRTQVLNMPSPHPLGLVIVPLTASPVMPIGPGRVVFTRPAAAALNVAVAPMDVVVSPLCGVSIDLSGDRIVQSPYLSLQAAGSDGSDASRGVLLRWFLQGVLEAHLPKGSLAKTANGFNKPDDFVNIYRADWPTNVPARRLIFATDVPIHVDEVDRIIFYETGTAPLRDLFAVRFLEATAFAAAKQVANPSLNPAAFIAAYGEHPLEVELRNVLAVACDLTFQSDLGASLQIETVSVGENRPLAARHVTSRRVLGPGDGPVARLFAENMCSVRVKAAAAKIQSVSFVGYDDVLTYLNQHSAWNPVGRFALSLDQPSVFHRLENPGHFSVHGTWRKFNDGAFVNVVNYQDRWTAPDIGLGAAVQTYIQLSETDPQATAPFSGAGPDDGSISMSYLDLLQIAGAIDFHIARMFGLGHVDDGVQSATPYVHLAEYQTLGDLQDGGGARPVRHLYMSLPTSLDQSRLPLTPDLDTIEYGLTVPTGSGLPYNLTSPQGYTPDGTARYIKLHPGCRPLYAPEQGFFDPADLFDLSNASLPVAYGVEYRGQDEAVWRKPEIAHDDAYVDTASPPVAEILTTPFPATQWASGYIHRETEAGIHEYAVFGVNVFSRPSVLGSARSTDTTVFTRRNTLLPPSDLQTQFIQTESTLVLTTAAEQAMLASLVQGGGDTTLVRVCCNYGMAQETAYGFADTIEIFHRGQVPGNVIGGIQMISPDSDPALIRIQTQPYTYASSQQVSSPVLPVAMKSNFLGGVLIAGSKRLVIEEIQWPGNSTGANPIFLVRKPTTTGVVYNASANTMLVEDVPLDIYPGDLVMAIENMANPANWGTSNPLIATVKIGDPSWTSRTESFIRPDGTTVSRQLRGVWETAQIDLAMPSDALPGDPKQYDIVFDTYVLGPHPQSGASNPVNWWKGTARVSVSGVGRDPEDRRDLTVLQVMASQNGKLVLRVIDNSGEPGDVNTGSAQLANYYPGYKTYLFADSANGFDGLNLLPAPGEGSRTTLLGLSSQDSSTLDNTGDPYRSNMSTPQLVAAVEIIEPKPPQKPAGLQYATPPDAYGMSSYTLTVNFDHKPFAAVFYRADALSIFDTLYDSNSLAGIRAAILPPEKDVWFTNRFEDLFAFLEDTRTAMDPFPSSAGFALPIPDAAALALGAGSLSVADKAAIKSAVLKAFVPLTEQPLIYDYIRADPTYVPTNRKQNFRNANGDFLPPGDPEFDLAPMAKRPGPTGANSVQFTDFTLDGSMNPNTVYFYFAREIGNRLQFSDPSPVWGPVKLVNLTPPVAPTLRKISTVPYDIVTQANPEVRFEVIAPSPIDPMAKLRIYRSTVAADALSVRSMQTLKDVDLTTLGVTADGTLVIADDFATDLATDGFIPFGELLYYRLAWIREVTYLNASQAVEVASVVSQPTPTFLANVLDVVNPPPPTPTLTFVSLAQNGDKFLSMSWNKTVHNGTYYLSRLDPSGNWTRIGSLKSNDVSPVFPLPDALPVQDEDDNLIYYRFKIDVEGPSGLLNTFDAPIIVSLDSIS